jgi:hypothetical protein
MVPCPNCGINNPNGAESCSKCGARIALSPAVPVQKAKPSKRNRISSQKRLLTAIIAIVVVGILIFILVLNPSTSIFVSLHDSDGDGVKDIYDTFPNDPTRWKPNTPEEAIDAYFTAYNTKDNYLVFQTMVVRFYKPIQFEYLNQTTNSSFYIGSSYLLSNVVNSTWTSDQQVRLTQRITSLESGLGIDVQDDKLIKIDYSYYYNNTFTVHTGEPMVCLMIDNWWYFDFHYWCLYDPNSPSGIGLYLGYYA